ncbi:photosystem II stability/assembly factor-like uncharacterized protein [Variovorax paradoxus]|nr:photosystem II stability/assembly factor-like uncharacterized protein [Variovorax paradoxus]
MTAVRFADANHGYAVGHSGVVLATQDGGNSWLPRFDGKKAARLVLQEAEASEDSNALREAQRLVNDGADKPFLDLHVFDAQRVLIVGAYNLAFYTEDGGKTWRSWMTRLPNPKALHWYAVRAKGSTILLAGEQGLALRSDDSGATFRRISTPYHGSFFTAELATTQDILLGGMRGNVWRSVDGGINWSQLVAPQTSSVTASAVRSSGQVLLATMGGELLTTAPTGSPNILTVERAGLPPLFSILSVSPEQVLLLGGHGAVMVNSENKK